MVKFADVILPIPIKTRLTYQIPMCFQKWIQVGSRVMVPLRSKKTLTGLVVKVHSVQPKYRTKEIITALSEAPIVTLIQLDFYHWLSNYYLCTIGEVVHAVLPSGLQLIRKQSIQLLDSALPTLQINLLSDGEQMLIQLLQKKSPLPYVEAAEILVRDIDFIVQSLLEKQIIACQEATTTAYRAQLINTIQLSNPHLEEQNALSLQLKDKPKQHNVLTQYLNYINQYPSILNDRNGVVPKKKLLELGISPSSLQTLIKHKVFIQEQIAVSRFVLAEAISKSPVQLSEVQHNALQSINEQFTIWDTLYGLLELQNAMRY